MAQGVFANEMKHFPCLLYLLLRHALASRQLHSVLILDDEYFLIAPSLAMNNECISLSYSGTVKYLTAVTSRNNEHSKLELLRFPVAAVFM